MIFILSIVALPSTFFLSFFNLKDSDDMMTHDQVALHHNDMAHVLNYLRHTWLDHLCNELTCLNFILYDTFEFLSSSVLVLTSRDYALIHYHDEIPLPLLYSFTLVSPLIFLLLPSLLIFFALVCSPHHPLKSF